MGASSKAVINNAAALRASKSRGLVAIPSVLKYSRTPKSKPRASKLYFVRPKPPTPPKVELINSVGWGVQVGVFSAYETAFDQTQRAIKALPSILTSARAEVDRAFGDYRQLYRARLLGLSETSARSACIKLLIQEFACLPIAPKGNIVKLAASSGRGS